MLLIWCRITASLLEPPFPSSMSPSLASSSISSPSTSIESALSTSKTNKTLKYYYHRHHHRDDIPRHHRRLHLHHHRLRRQRRGQSIGASNFCEEVNISVPLSFLVMLYLVYLVESWHCRLRFALKSSATTREVYRVIGDARSCRSPRLVWRAAGYHYSRKTDYLIKNRGGHVSKRGCYFYYERVNTYKRSSFFDYKSFCSRCQHDCVDICRNGKAEDTDSVNDDDRDSVKTKVSFLSSDEDRKPELLGNLSELTSAREVHVKSARTGSNRIEDRSENLTGLDDFPATRVLISLGFEFESCSVLREYERQRKNFCEVCSNMDDFMEFEERLELPGCDVKGSYFAVRTKHHHHPHHRSRRHRHLSFFKGRHFAWLRIPPISSFAFWFFTFLFLSWPYRLAVELNTASVVLKIRKVFVTDSCNNCNNCIHACKTNKAARTSHPTTSSKFNKTCHGSMDVARKSRIRGCLRFLPPDDRECDSNFRSNSSTNTTGDASCLNVHPLTSKHFRQTDDSFCYAFYRRPPSFTKTRSALATASFCSPRLVVKYFEDENSFSSEIRSQKCYKTVLETSSSCSSIPSKSKLQSISEMISEVKTKIFRAPREKHEMQRGTKKTLTASSGLLMPL